MSLFYFKIGRRIQEQARKPTFLKIIESFFRRKGMLIFYANWHELFSRFTIRVSYTLKIADIFINQQPRPKGTRYASEKTFLISRQASGN